MSSGRAALAAAGTETAWELRVVALGELDSRLWGAAWVPADGSSGGVLGVGEQASTGAARLDGHDAEQPWRLKAEEGELALEGLRDPAWVDPEDPQAGFDQLCRVTGTVTVGQQSHEVSCLGWRSARGERPDRSISSLRQLAAWFEEDEGFAVLARRQREGKGQDEDQVAAALFDASDGRAVAEPRLSTTYDESGHPARAGVELWIEVDHDSERLYPRRAVGQATRSPVAWTVDGLALEAQPFHWYAGDRQGAGIYLLGRR